MVGISLEESTVSESSLDASTAPTTATGHSTTNPSHDSLPSPPSPTHLMDARRERSSTALAETLVKDVSFPPPLRGRIATVASFSPVPHTCFPYSFPTSSVQTAG